MSKRHRTNPDETWQPLLIESAGVCCAVGYHLAAAACALRASMDHFQESEFVDRNGVPLKLARLPLGDLWGAKRLVEIANMAIKDCIDANEIDPATTALLMLDAERDRPHTEIERYQEVAAACKAAFEKDFHATSIIYPHGRAGIGNVLLYAKQLLAQRKVTRVLLFAADSFLNAATIEYYLSQERLLTSDNSNGFIPGEAAAALLLTLADENAEGLVIAGLGIGQEEAKIDGEIPNRAMGLTQAMRRACESAEIKIGDLQFRMNDQNGEEYYAKEAANAYTRLTADDSVFLPLLHIADCVGETGAAAGPLSLAYLTQIMSREDGPGTTGLLHFANDNGLRAACVVQYRE